MCVVGPDIYRRANRNAARELDRTLCNRAPCAVARSSTQRCVAEDSERTATAIARKAPNRLAGQLMVNPTVSYDKQSVVPGSDKNSQHCHRDDLRS